MSYTGKALTRWHEVLVSMPGNTQFDISRSCLDFQAHTNAQARKLRAYFPGLKWVRSYNKACQWWEWKALDGDGTIKIYAINETPASCNAITQTRMVKKQVPVAFEEREVEETVIVGWDCGQEHDAVL